MKIGVSSYSYNNISQFDCISMAANTGFHAEIERIKRCVDVTKIL